MDTAFGKAFFSYSFQRIKASWNTTEFVRLSRSTLLRFEVKCLQLRDRIRCSSAKFDDWTSQSDSGLCSKVINTMFENEERRESLELWCHFKKVQSVRSEWVSPPEHPGRNLSPKLSSSVGTSCQAGKCRTDTWEDCGSFLLSTLKVWECGQCGHLVEDFIYIKSKYMNACLKASWEQVPAMKVDKNRGFLRIS